METIIKKNLEQIEQEHDIVILYACESGSRCWGFASPDSDYDVRFIYKHRTSWYFNIHEPKDTLEFPINELLDIGGWELRKTLQLLHKSNAPLLEWLQSPIVYTKDADFLTELQNLSQEFYSPISVYHHYQSMATKYAEALDGQSFKLKSFFYALRAALSAKWTIECELVPPVQLSGLLTLVEDKALQQKINELVAIKSNNVESYMHPSDSALSMFINNLLAQNVANKDQLVAKKGDAKSLNNLLYRKVAL